MYRFVQKQHRAYRSWFPKIWTHRKQKKKKDLHTLTPHWWVWQFIALFWQPCIYKYPALRTALTTVLQGRCSLFSRLDHFFNASLLLKLYISTKLVSKIIFYIIPKASTKPRDATILQVFRKYLLSFTRKNLKKMLVVSLNISIYIVSIHPGTPLEISSKDSKLMPPSILS